MSKQSELHKLIMHLQLEQITALRTWMTKTEDRISLLGQSGKDLEEVRTQLREVDDLQGDLENQHTAVSAISNFILVESDEAINIEDELAGNLGPDFMNSKQQLDCADVVQPLL